MLSCVVYTVQIRSLHRIEVVLDDKRPMNFVDHHLCFLQAKNRYQAATSNYVFAWFQDQAHLPKTGYTCRARHAVRSDGITSLTSQHDPIEP
jgi:hypothetical protein